MNEKSSGIVVHESDRLGVGGVPVRPGDSDIGSLGLEQKNTILEDESGLQLVKTLCDSA